jgi:hypothetical protein
MRLDGIELYVLLELFCSAQKEIKSFVCLQGSTCNMHSLPYLVITNAIR